MSSSGNEKVCAICGEDCSNKPRTKDSKGRYYCKPCHERALRAKTKPEPKAATIRPMPPPKPRREEPVSLLDDLIPDAAPVAAAGSRMCANCGSAIASDAVICLNCGFNTQTGHAMVINQTSREPSGPRQRATTVLGVLAIVLGSLGLLCLTAALVAIFAAAEQQVIEASSAYISTAIGLLCKVGLISVGVLMLMRHRYALPVAIGTFALSMIGSAHDLVFITLPQLDAAPADAGDAYAAGYRAGQTAGFVIATLIVIAIYLTLIRHLRKPSTRAEFGMA